MSSKLARDSTGHLVVVITSPSAGLDTGAVFQVRGNGISTGDPGDPGEYFFVGTKTGHPWVPPAARLRGRMTPTA